MAEHNGWINPWGMCLAAFPRSIREGFLIPGEGAVCVRPTALPGQHDSCSTLAAFPLSELQGALDWAAFMPVIGDMARQGFDDVGGYQEGFLFAIRSGQNDHATFKSLFGDIALPGVLDAIDRNAAYPVREFMGMMEPSCGEFTPNTTALPSLCFDDERFAELYRGQDFHWPRKSPLEWIFMLKGR